MNKLLILIFTIFFSLFLTACDGSKEKPVQHIKAADVTSMEDAKKIFIEKTSEIKSKKQLSQLELQQIHIITYSLEKSVAYFIENLKAEKQEAAKEIAVVVENIHLSSENNHREKTEAHLNTYFNLAEEFSASF